MAKKNTADKRTGSIQVFGNALLRVIVGLIRNNNVDGTVVDVDEAAFTATIKVGEVNFYAVPLRVLVSSQASFVEVPKVGTQCAVTFRDANMGRPYILEVHECSKILYKVGASTCEVSPDAWIFNGGTLGGMVKLEAILSAVNRIEDKFNSHKHSGVTSGGSLSGPPDSTISNTSRGDIENTKIKQ